MKKELNNKILALSKQKQVLFCFHMIKRLWPNYIVFYNAETFGDPNFIDKINLVVDGFFKKSLSRAQLSQINEEVEAIGPHSEDYPSVLSSYALDAAAACFDILVLIGDDDPESAIRTSELALNTVYLSVIDKMDLKTTNAQEYSDDEIDESQEMKNELTFQNNLIARLNEVQDINLLVEEAFDTEYESNIGLK